MSAYLVNLDTLELLAAIACDWNPERHDSGLHLTLLDDRDSEPLTGAPIVTNEFGGYRRAEIRLGDNAAVVRELYAANVASLAERYPTNWQELIYYTLPENYRAGRVDRDQVTIGQAIGAVKCYQFHACEFEGWLYSFAYRLTQEIKDRLLDIQSDGWEWQRPADQGTRISILDLTR